MSSRLPRHLFFATLLTGGLIVAATGCAGTADPAPSTPDAGGTPTAAPGEPGEPGTTPEPEETGGAVAPTDVTCETLISADSAASLAEQGWTSREDPFLIGDLEIAEGISCTWGDFSAPAGDDLLLFGWAPISSDEAVSVQTTLEAEGWIIEEGDDGTYLTEDPATAIAVDEEGYGMTYFFGDGWVTLSDTKQSLVLIEVPSA